MTTPNRSLTRRSLAPTALDILDALHQHRLLTTSQLRELVLAGGTLRRTQQLLDELVRRKLVDWVAVRGKWPGPADSRTNSRQQR